ncbi:hypothetical protein FQA39_LY07330 [Lamprigera yunnana]|nr:hypothetical protein FQA39_LY07330 [Lamprigera yunnana]
MEYKNEDHLTNVHHDSARKCSGWIPVRITLYILCLSGIIITYMMNLTINLLIPSFVKQHPSELTKIHITERLCYLPKNYSHSVAANDETFNWSLDVQRYVVTSYYASYIILQLVGGIVVQYFGSKAAFGYGIFISALSNLFVPLAHNVHYICAVTLQTFQGAAHGLIWPCVFRSVNQWVPVQERSRFLTCIHGIFLGTALSHAVLRPLIVKIGWIYAYYVTGSIGLLWVLFWYLWAYDTPEIHPRITSNELQHIQKNRGKILQHKKSIPWKCIFSSMPVWAIVVACFGRMWLISTAVLYWNKYLEASGLVIGLAQCSIFMITLMFSFVSDKIAQHKVLRVSYNRKLFTAMSQIIPGLLTMVLSHLNCNIPVIMGVWCLIHVFASAGISGAVVNIVDVSPNFAAPVSALVNTVMMSSSLFAVAVTNLFLKSGSTASSWHGIFYISGSISILTYLFYNTFSSGHVQKWDCSNNVKKSRLETALEDELVNLSKTKGVDCIEVLHEFKMFH